MAALRALASWLPRTSVGQTFSANAAYTEELQNLVVPDHLLPLATAMQGLPQEVRLLRIHRIGKFVPIGGALVGGGIDISCRLVRYCVQEPSYSICWSVRINGVLLPELFPLTKEEKLVLSTITFSVEEALLAFRWPNLLEGRILYVIDDVPPDPNQPRFVRHAGATNTGVPIGPAVAPTKTVRAGFVTASNLPLFVPSAAAVVLNVGGKITIEPKFPKFGAFMSFFVLFALSAADNYCFPNDTYIGYLAGCMLSVFDYVTTNTLCAAGFCTDVLNVVQTKETVKEISSGAVALWFAPTKGGASPRDGLVNVGLTCAQGFVGQYLFRTVVGWYFAASKWVWSTALVPFVATGHFAAFGAKTIWHALPALSGANSTFGAFTGLAATAIVLAQNTTKVLDDTALLPFVMSLHGARWVLNKQSALDACFPLPRGTFWEAAVVTFWRVVEEAGKPSVLSPIGGASCVSNALLTNRHVFDALRIAVAMRWKLYVSRCEAVVTDTSAMIEWKDVPTESFGPSEADYADHPIAGDFCLIAMPKKIAELKLKTGGRVGFSQNVDIVRSGYYKQQTDPGGSSYFQFFQTCGVVSSNSLVIDTVAHHGAATWTGGCAPGASGYPLLDTKGNRRAIHVGALEHNNQVHGVCATSEGIISFYLTRGVKYFQGKRFGLGLICLPPQISLGNLTKVGAGAIVCHEFDDDAGTQVVRVAKNLDPLLIVAGRSGSLPFSEKLQITKQAYKENANWKTPDWRDDADQRYSDFAEGIQNDEEDAKHQEIEDRANEEAEQRAEDMQDDAERLADERQDKQDKWFVNDRSEDRIKAEDLYDEIEEEQAHHERGDGQHKGMVYKNRVPKGYARNANLEEPEHPAPPGLQAPTTSQPTFCRKLCVCGQGAVALGLCLACTAYWLPFHEGKALRASKLTSEQEERKARIVDHLRTVYPLTIYEELYCRVFSPSDGKTLFASDSRGEPYLYHIGTTSQPRHDGVGKKKKKKSNQTDEAGEPIVELTLVEHLRKAAKAIGIDFDGTPAQRDARAQRSSLIANASKSIGDRFEPTREYLSPLECRPPRDVLPPLFDTQDRFERAYKEALITLKLDRSAGSDGHAHGATTKGDLIEKKPEQLMQAVKTLLERLAYVGSSIGLFSPAEQLALGLSSVVHPCIKDEFHPPRKVFQQKEGKTVFVEGKPLMLENPFWRSIIVQSTARHMARTILLGNYSKSDTTILQEGQPIEVVDNSSIVGMSRGDEGLQKFFHVVEKLRAEGCGNLISADVTGMDWSVGASGALDGYTAQLHHPRADQRWRDANCALSWTIFNSLYVIGSDVYEQASPGVVPSGDKRTSQLDNAVRIVDSALAHGLIECEVEVEVDGELIVEKRFCRPVRKNIVYGDDMVSSLPTELQSQQAVFPVLNYRSPLQERNIEVSKPGQPVNMLGSNFIETSGPTGPTFVYQLERWTNSIVSIIQSKLEDKTETGIAKRAQQIQSFRFENRAHPAALTSLGRLIQHFKLEDESDLAAQLDLVDSIPPAQGGCEDD